MLTKNLLQNENYDNWKPEMDKNTFRKMQKRAETVEIWNLPGRSGKYHISKYVLRQSYGYNF